MQALANPNPNPNPNPNQALAKGIEKVEDAVMPTVDEYDEAAGDEAGLDDDALPANGHG